MRHVIGEIPCKNSSMPLNRIGCIGIIFGGRISISEYTILRLNWQAKLLLLCCLDINDANFNFWMLRCPIWRTLSCRRLHYIRMKIDDVLLQLGLFGILGHPILIMLSWWSKIVRRWPRRQWMYIHGCRVRIGWAFYRAGRVVIWWSRTRHGCSECSLIWLTAEGQCPNSIDEKSLLAKEMDC